MQSEQTEQIQKVDLMGGGWAKREQTQREKKKTHPSVDNLNTLPPKDD